MNQYVLIVEDEIKISRLLQEYLEKSDFKVSCLDSGAKVIDFIKTRFPDMLILDIMLPDTDGMELCSNIRDFSNIPIIMVTARISEAYRLKGLSKGADDYICKPFSPREVVARVKTVLKRSVQNTPASDQIVVGSLILDRQSHQAEVSNKIQDLTRSEYMLLELMMGNPKRVFSRSELLSKVQDYDFAVYDRVIDSHIKNLRKKLEALLPGKDIISTVYGMGYKLNPWEN